MIIDAQTVWREYAKRLQKANELFVRDAKVQRQRRRFCFNSRSILSFRCKNRHRLIERKCSFEHKQFDILVVYRKHTHFTVCKNKMKKCDIKNIECNLINRRVFFPCEDEFFLLLFRLFVCLRTCPNTPDSSAAFCSFAWHLILILVFRFAI